jgi:hypothetical protein
MGSTGVLLTAWRALASQVLSTGQKKDDVYKKGNPFELFEVRFFLNNYNSIGDFI